MSARTIRITITILIVGRERRGRPRIGPSVGGLMRGSVVALPHL
jgi:hypothetical protein